MGVFLLSITGIRIELEVEDYDYNGYRKSSCRECAC